MEITQLHYLRGPNIWSRHPVIEAWVALGDLSETSSDLVPGFTDRLMAWIPSLIEHRCSEEVRGGFLDRLRRGTWPGHILEHVALELQTLAGSRVGFGRTRETSTPGTYKVVIRYEDERVGKAALFEARDLLMAAYQDRPFDVAASIAQLKALIDDRMLGPSTRSIVEAARERGIPSIRLSEGSLVQLGYGKYSRRVWTAESDRTSAIAESIAQDKELTKTLLRSAGVPVPRGRQVESAADAWEAARELEVPVVVKPRDGNHGRGVCTNLKDQKQIEQAYAVARQEGSGVIVEAFAEGCEHRLLVVGGELVAAARGEIATVTGDGLQTLRALIDTQLNSDVRRGADEDCPLYPIEVDSPVVRFALEQQGCAPDSVPADGVRIIVQRNGNVSHDVTDEVHPDTARQAVLAAKVVGLDIAGIDLIATDISKPLGSQGGAIVEVNAGPGLHAHLLPSSGKKRPVGKAIVGTLFAPDEKARLPIACVAGSRGAGAVTQLLGDLLRPRFERLGVASCEGLKVGTRALESGDGTGYESVRRLLVNRTVDAAVIELEEHPLLTEGMAFDRCDVAVVTGIDPAQTFPEHSIDTPEYLFRIYRCGVDLVGPDGFAVLKADDPRVAEMASLCAGSVIFFARDADHPVLLAHRADGGRTVHPRDGFLCLAEDGEEAVVCSVETLGLGTCGCTDIQLEQFMAAAGAAWAMGMPHDAIRAGLGTWSR